ncbi:Pentapeptide repeat-containing protein [Cryptosporangium aurantiacum]|uniref:Pentapeptide repeat-containing protein n=1 Tax=Cryptosporangium aurantiacum TaxID=134849 RepID=A0A1M7KT95_9ACTN|nr:Pentapeptide repeat-containing protein [Cryptosporangium aurantiacum]
MSIPPRPRQRDSWLWALRLVVLGAMVATSRQWGPFGVVAAGVVTVGVITLIVGGATFEPRVQLRVVVSVCVLIVLVFLGQATGVISDEPGGTAKAGGASAAPSPADTKTVQRLKEGAGRGATLGSVVLDGQNLSDTHLDGVSAAGSSFTDAVLNRSSLAGSDLSGASLRGAKLRGANLRGANLTGVDLRDADLTDACLNGADLTGAVLDRAVLRGAAVSGARVDQSTTVRAVAWGTPSQAGTAACLLGP